MWLRKLWRKLFPVREVYFAVPKGYETPATGETSQDPRFLRQMAESMSLAPVVYQNMNNMLQRRLRILAQPLPTTSQAERDSARWAREQLAAETDILRTLLLAPVTAKKALEDIAKHKKDAQSEEWTNWALEGTEK